MTALDEGIGALYIGLVVCTFLHGVTLSQAWHFFSSQNRTFEDPWSLKALVAAVVALDFIHQVCTSIWLYEFLITDFGNFTALALLPRSYLGMAVPTGIATILVQGFYVWRIWKLANKNWIIPGVISLCAIAQEATQLYSMTVIAANRDSTQFTGDLTTIVIVVNGLGAGVDVLIALSMVYLLGRRRSKIIKTNRMLRQIAIYSVTTGAMTSICALMVLVTAIKFKTAQYVLLFYLMLTRMYANSLLATLNVRDSIKASNSGGAIVNSSGFTHPQLSNHPPATSRSDAYHLDDLKRPPRDLGEDSIAIKIDRQTEVGVY
ncbi:hypothetical protein V5O48_001619 [Marasmius crinis-equi]|uniref:DUF6534 domain-containing protein n=1 Tax=Marasmius crinis-equi TaxID=585013 RepID=A0ABR3FY87_9AGAR